MNSCFPDGTHHRITKTSSIMLGRPLVSTTSVCVNSRYATVHNSIIQFLVGFWYHWFVWRRTLYIFSPTNSHVSVSIPWRFLCAETAPFNGPQLRPVPCFRNVFFHTYTDPWLKKFEQNRIELCSDQTYWSTARAFPFFTQTWPAASYSLTSSSSFLWVRNPRMNRSAT